MCGRYDLNESPQMLALYFLLSAEPEAFSNSDVRPANVAPIIRIHEGLRLALPTRWGLIPSWSKDDKIAQHTFSARAETVEKPVSARHSSGGAALCTSLHSSSGGPYHVRMPRE